MSAQRTAKNLQQELDTLRGRIADLETRLSAVTDGSPADRTAQESITKLQEEIVERQRVEEMLEKQRRFLRQVVDVDPNFIFAKDRDGRFTLVNQAVADAYGTTVEALIGKTDADFNPNTEEVRFFRQVDLEVMDTLKQRFIPEEAITDSTGRVRWLQTVKRPLVGDDGTAQQVLGSATDITARRQAEEDLRRSEAALRKSQSDLRLLAAKLLTGQEEERRRLAREMHDDVSQRLAALAIETGRLEQAVEGENERLQVGLQALSRQVVDLSNDVHDISHRLHPSILEDLGLEDALASECKGFTRREHIQVQFRAEGVPSTLPPELALCLYRITQEGLRNIAKHAKTDRVRVSLAGNGAGLTLTIEDDGCGFDRASVAGHQSLGLASMEERARMIHAELEVESHPGQGTRIRVSAPVGSVSALEPAEGLTR